jgi:hypothetical protein
MKPVKIVLRMGKDMREQRMNLRYIVSTYINNHNISPYIAITCYYQKKRKSLTASLEDAGKPLHILKFSNQMGKRR